MENNFPSILQKDITTLISRVATSKDISQMLSEGLTKIGDTSTVFSLAKGIYQTVENIKIRAFVIQLHDAIYQNQKGEFGDAQIIIDYLSKRRNIEIIAGIIDASLHSQSINCSALLGTFAGGLLSNQKEIDYRDIVIVNTLRLMNDRDLYNFFVLYNMIKDHPEIGKAKDSETHARRIFDFSKEIEKRGIRPFDMEMTVEKLKSVQAIGYDVGGFGGFGNSWGAFVFNENSLQLFDLISSANLKGIVRF